MTKKRKLPLNTYSLLTDAVDRGVTYGWNRAHKYADKPKEEYIREKIADEVMSALSEVVLWPDEEGVFILKAIDGNQYLADTLFHWSASQAEAERFRSKEMARAVAKFVGPSRVVRLVRKVKT